MNEKVQSFETHRFTFVAAQLFIGWIMTLWALNVWAFNVYILRKNPHGNFSGALGLFEFSSGCRAVREGSTSWKALKLIYNWYGDFGFKPAISRDPFAWFWLKNVNGQAVRNRLKIIVRELMNAIAQVSQKNNEVRILSIASGSAQSIFLAIKGLRDNGFTGKISLCLLDLDREALEYSKKLAEIYNISSSDISFIVAPVSHIKKELRGQRFDIIEMAGLLDYLTDRQAFKLMKRIYSMLAPGGYFVTCHIHPNFEMYFMRWVCCWQMIYRTISHFSKIIREAAAWNSRIITEPHYIHSVAVCKKDIKEN